MKRGEIMSASNYLITFKPNSETKQMPVYSTTHPKFQVKFLSLLTHWGLVTPHGIGDLGNTGSGNGLLPDDTKPLPEPVLTYHK